MKLLADTSALLALIRGDDAHHREAERWLRATPSARFLMTDLVFGETLTRLAAGAGGLRAAALGNELLKGTRFTVVFVDEQLVRGALEKMARFADKRLSFADCASFELMDRLSLDAAFTFDRDFRDCGYRTVPER